MVEATSAKRWILAAVAVALCVIAAMFATPLLIGPDSLVLSVMSAGNALDDPVLKRAAENDDHAAQFKLGEALFQDPARTGKTAIQAMYWLEAAAKGGNVEAMVYLGRVLRSGVGVLQNFTRSSFWIDAAARQGSADGMLEMGRLYRDGLGVERDLIKAYIWFNHAAAAHNLEAASEREAIMHILTPGELNEAQQQSRLPTYEGEENRSARKTARK
jgi:TPR repeat protein